jgi:hypothetical protein
MAKKSKKKTLASTRPLPPEKKQPEQPEKKKKIFPKLFLKGGKESAQQKAEKTDVADYAESVGKILATETAEKALAPDKAPTPDKAPQTVETPAKPKKERRRILGAHRQKIRGGLLILIGLFSLAFIGWFLFGKMFRPQYIAEILPASDTLAVLEINTDGAASQPKQFYELMSKYPVYSKDALVKLMTYVLPVDFAKDVEPWLGRRVGLAIVNGPTKGQMERLYFVESRDHEMTLKFLKGRALQSANEEMTSRDFKGYKVYGYPISHLFEFTFINNYLVIAENGTTMESVLDNIAAGGQKLADDAAYAKASNNLPQGSLVFAYADFRKLYETLSANQDFMARKGQDFMAFKPFLAVFKSAGITVFADKDKFAVQSFTNLDKEALKDGQYITFSEKYKGKLLSISGEEPVLLAGGHDLTKELNRLQELFRGGTKTSSLIFEGLLEAQKQIYLGKEISLQDDVYPLLMGEYLFTIDNSLEKPQMSLILEMTDKARDLPHFEKIVTAFRNTSGIFTPKVQTVTLPDGTTGQEIVASPETVEKYDEKYADKDLVTLKLGNTGWNIFYAAVDDKLLISTSKDLLKNMIDRADGVMPNSLASSPFYAKILGPMMSTADEIINIKVGALTQALGLNDNKILKPYLLPFANLAVAKNYFTDGISTIYYLEVI